MTPSSIPQRIAAHWDAAFGELHTLLGRISPALGTSYTLVEWLIPLAMLFVVPRRRDASATRSWLLLIFFLPIPGLLLYLVIGRPHFPKWRAERFRKLLPLFDETARRLEAQAGGEATVGPVTALARTLGKFPATTGNAIELLDDYDAMIDRLVSDIDGATRHVRVLIYIFADDATGMKVIGALVRAAGRGVVCHVLIDALGSRRWAGSVMRQLTAAGIVTRRALPFHLLRGRTRRDMRDHRKLVAIDGAIGYAGSQNIVDKDFNPRVVNRELVVRAMGPVVAEIAATIIADWYLESEMLIEPAPAPPAPAGHAVAQLLPSGADYPLQGFATLLIWRIHEARERVIITTPYLIPDEDLLGAMRTAVVRGVEVHIVLSAAVDQRLVNLAQRSYYDDLLKAGVRIHLFREFLLHAKNVSIDATLAVVGSSNVDLRSFQLNEEVSLLLYDAASIAAVARIQLGYLAASDEVTVDAWGRRPLLAKLAEAVARMVSPLL